MPRRGYHIKSVALKFATHTRRWKNFCFPNGDTCNIFGTNSRRHEDRTEICLLLLLWLHYHHYYYYVLKCVKVLLLCAYGRYAPRTMLWETITFSFLAPIKERGFAVFCSWNCSFNLFMMMGCEDASRTDLLLLTSITCFTIILQRILPFACNALLNLHALAPSNLKQTTLINAQTSASEIKGLRPRRRKVLVANGLEKVRK